MAVATHAVVALDLGVAVGVQVLAAANREALGVAVAAGASFIRAEAFAYAHVADEGWIDASAAEVLRARAALRSDVRVWADVQKKHAAHAITGDVSLAETARAAHFCGADGVIVTGASTGEPTGVDDLTSAADASPLPVLAGSGVTEWRVKEHLPACRAVIVGSARKHDGDWRNPVDPSRAAGFVRAARA